MPDPSLHTTYLQNLLPRLRAGDREARDELVRASQVRLEAMARRMLRRYPVVARWADDGDVFQGAVMRLLRALEAVDVADTRGFLNLAAAQMRRELLDLARHFRGPHGLDVNHASVGGDSTAARLEPAAPQDDATELDRWSALHAAVEGLPAEQREAFGLRFYHRWSEAEVAELFGVDERTVRRRWRAACDALSTVLGGQLPDTGDGE